MPQITLQVDKETVWNEVIKTSGYTGDKMLSSAEDDNPYERILLTDEDKKSLQLFWEESVTVANNQLKEMLITASSMTDDYKVVLQVSRSYDTILNASVQSAIKSYFIAAIVARWYKFSNKTEAQGYFTEAAAMMEDALRKLYSRRSPIRPKRRTTTPPTTGPAQGTN